jgi:hypothetical protein
MMPHTLVFIKFQIKGLIMRKKFIYIGLALLAIAAIIFFALGSISLFGGILSKGLTTSNVTVASGGFSYVPVTTVNASLIVLYTATNGKANIYLFNTSAFYSWSNRMHGNSSSSGLAYATALGTNSSRAIDSNVEVSELLLTKNTSTADQNSSILSIDNFGDTAYVVIDNSMGSTSYNTSIRAVVSYLRLTSDTLGAYNSTIIEAVVIVGADFILGVAGIILIIYGFLRRAPDSGTEAVGKGAEPMSKEYINALYKNVDKKKRRV